MKAECCNLSRFSTWIRRNIDPQNAVGRPVRFCRDQFDHNSGPNTFYMRPGGTGQELPERLTRALQLSLEGRIPSCEKRPPISSIEAIFASAALPVVFDPVSLPVGDGTNNSYCDGGVASNSPVGVAHSIASAADVILLDPQFERGTALRRRARGRVRRVRNDAAQNYSKWKCAPRISNHWVNERSNAFRQRRFL